MSKIKELAGHRLGFSNRVKAQVIENGRVVRETDWAPNLILNSGMDFIGTNRICDMFLACAVGTNNTSDSRTSGSVTGTVNTGTGVLTASSASGWTPFGSGDVGAVVAFANHVSAPITVFTDTTHVTLATPPGGWSTVSAQLFTVYNTNRSTSLDAEVRRSNSYTPGQQSSVFTAGLNTFTRTYDFPVESGSVTYTEVGLSNSAVPNDPINVRALFASSVSLSSGQQLRVVYQLLVSFTPVTPRLKTVAITGWPALQNKPTWVTGGSVFTLASHGLTNGSTVVWGGTTAPTNFTIGTTYFVKFLTSNTFQLCTSSALTTTLIANSQGSSDVYLATNTTGSEQLQTQGWSSVNSDGTTGLPASGQAVNEPYDTARGCCLSNDSTALPAFPAASPATQSLPSPNGNNILTSPPAYTTGNYSLTWTFTFQAADAVTGTPGTNTVAASGARKLFLTSYTADSAHGVADGLVFLFQEPQIKDASHTLAVNWKFAWGWSF